MSSGHWYNTDPTTDSIMLLVPRRWRACVKMGRKGWGGPGWG